MARLLILKTGSSFSDVITEWGDFEHCFQRHLGYVAHQASRLRQLGQCPEALRNGLHDTPEASSLLATFADLVVEASA